MIHWGILFLLWGFLFPNAQALDYGAVLQATNPDVELLTILHTNDIHSHFEKDTTNPFELGGVSRIGSYFSSVRTSQPNTLVLDGGDWSEGHIYFNIGAGRLSLQMMNTLGYDAMVVGNHDWLNGPDHLLNLLQNAPENRVHLLGANLDYSAYPRASELSARVKPYTIIQKGNIKIGIIGACTYEFIYDRYFQPVKIEFPLPVVRRLAQELKTTHGVDLVVVVSHNPFRTNRLIASLPNVDVVIHSHDHHKYDQPIEVVHAGKKALLVEAGKWGHFVGNLRLWINKRTHAWGLSSYQLKPMNELVPEDPLIAQMVRASKEEIRRFYRRQGYGNIFTQRITTFPEQVTHDVDSESVLADMIADSYRSIINTDIAFEHRNFISGVIASGPVFLVDLINSLIRIFNPETEKTWTLYKMRMLGSELKGIMTLLYLVQDIVPGGMPSVSGMRVVYNQTVANQLSSNRAAQSAADSDAISIFEVGGAPLDLRREYSAALTEGLIQSLEFLETRFGYRINRTSLEDTGIQTWDVLRRYLSRFDEFRLSRVSLGNRIQTTTSDLAIFPHDVTLTMASESQSASTAIESPYAMSERGKIHFRLKVRNVGNQISAQTMLVVGYDETPDNPADDPKAHWLSGQNVVIPRISPNEAVTVSGSFNVPSWLWEKDHFVAYLNIMPAIGTSIETILVNNSIQLVWKKHNEPARHRSSPMARTQHHDHEH